MVVRRNILIFALCSLLLVPAFGESVKDLQKKQKKLQQEIEQTNKMLKQTKKDETATLNNEFTIYPGGGGDPLRFTKQPEDVKMRERVADDRKLAGILVSKIINMKEYNNDVVKSSRMMIPIDDVYYALINNNVIDIDHIGR